MIRLEGDNELLAEMLLAVGGGLLAGMLIVLLIAVITDRP